MISGEAVITALGSQVERVSGRHCAGTDEHMNILNKRKSPPAQTANSRGL